MLVVGYTSAKSQKETVYGYYTVPYPIGYIDINKTFFIPMTAEFSIIAMGYKTKDSVKLLDLLGKYYEMSKYASMEQYPYILVKIVDAVEVKKKEREE